MRIHGVLATLLAVLPAASPTIAQTADLRGSWQADVGGRTCSLTLGQDNGFGRHQASSFGCAGDLVSLNGYGVRGSEVVLLGIADKELARLRLRGDQLVGTSASGDRVFLRRAGAPPILRSGRPGPFYGGAQGCIGFGKENRCAGPADLEAPAFGASVRTLTQLNLRTGPAFSEAILGTFPQDVCIRVGECRRNGDGLWCRTDLLGKEGWVVKVSPDANGGRPFATYANGCR